MTELGKFYDVNSSNYPHQQCRS